MPTRTALPFLRPIDDDRLSVGQCKDLLANYLGTWSGLAILPSDCGYTWCCIPNHPTAVKAIDAMADHATVAIPLSLPNTSVAARFVDWTTLHLRLVETLWPGQLTVVVKVKGGEGRRIASLLHGRDTLGLRISLSTIEWGLAVAAEYPLTTAAIRNHDGQLVRTYDEAVDIVLDKLDRVDIGSTPIVGVRRRRRIEDRDHSTVVEIDHGALKTLREGAVPVRELRPLINRVARAEFGDST